MRSVAAGGVLAGDKQKQGCGSSNRYLVHTLSYTQSLFIARCVPAFFSGLSAGRDSTRGLGIENVSGWIESGRVRK